ncbi:hypothetical protein ACFE33_11030 [Falsihalocynthiibacter sp. SS001]|uniref:hypothetical protein n=1 Tax=Falsihalocynthiibacter sp. SS001 TaxID=3349698 RepID=UPI0036D310E4
MVGENKILTVSYGTFSCTLEGFDDSFSTMKAIAEYFKGLAAEDRYFGAEPPAPDAEMLARIAEKEIRSRVEAQIGESGILLRKSEETARPAVTKAETAKAPEMEPEEEAPAPAQPFTARREEIDGGSVAAKLQRIRAVVSRAPESIAEEVIEDANTEFVSIESAFQDIEEPAAPAQSAVETTEAPDAYEAEEAVADAPLAEIEEDEQFEEEIEPEVATEEATHDEEDDILAGIGASLSTPEVAADEVAEEVAELEEEADDSADITSILGAIATQDTSVEITVDEDELAVEEELTVEEEVEEELLQADEAIEEDEIVAEEAAPVQEEPASIDFSVLNADEEEETAREAEEAPVEAQKTDVMPQRVAKRGVSGVAARARARVLGASTTDAENTEVSAETASSLSAEAEAELAADLAAVETEEAPKSEHKPLPKVTPHRPLSKKADEDNVERLMQESENKFAETEGTRRRSAIAHLKAAVAATVADRKILGGSKPKADDQTDTYRQDLAESELPKPLNEGKEKRPAPLVLVSEQRIDLGDGTALHPRRVSKSAPELREVNKELAEENAKLLADSKSFAEFAERVGATELPDLLEAAAAYASYVEGQDHFTRPDVMRRVLRFGEEQGLTREDGMRSFGILLREGKIEKIKRGQFRIAETTRFNPHARIAGE